MAQVALEESVYSFRLSSQKYTNHRHLTIRCRKSSSNITDISVSLRSARMLPTVAKTSPTLYLTVKEQSQFRKQAQFGGHIYINLFKFLGYPWAEKNIVWLVRVFLTNNSYINLFSPLARMNRILCILISLNSMSN